MTYIQSNFDRRRETALLISDIIGFQERLAMVYDSCEGMNWADVCEKLHKAMSQLQNATNNLEIALNLEEAKNG